MSNEWLFRQSWIVRVVDWLRWRKPVQVDAGRQVATPRRFGHWLNWFERLHIRRFLIDTEQWDKLDQFDGYPKGKPINRVEVTDA